MSITSSTSHLSGLVLGDTADDDRGGILYNNTSDFLYFLSNAQERLRINSSGTVQVRNETPTIQLYNTDTSLSDEQTLGDLDWYQTDPSGSGANVVAKIRGVNESSFQGQGALAFHVGASGGVSEAMRIDSSGNVGIGGSSKLTGYLGTFRTLYVHAPSGDNSAILELAGNRNAAAGNQNVMIQFWNKTSTAVEVGRITSSQGTAVNSGELQFATSSSGTLTERMRILSGGGITFNGDTATANALDDYEEGTWTPQVYYQNGTDQTNSTDVTQVGTYTKIGRQVTLCGVLEWTITGSPAVDNVGIKNCPFIAQNSTDYISFGQLQIINADSYPTGTLNINISQNSSVSIFTTNDGLSNQGSNIGTSGTKSTRFTITYFV